MELSAVRNEVNNYLEALQPRVQSASFLIFMQK